MLFPNKPEQGLPGPTREALLWLILRILYRNRARKHLRFIQGMKSPLVWRGMGREREASVGDVSVQTEPEETISRHFRIWRAAKEYKKKSRSSARDNEQKD